MHSWQIKKKVFEEAATVLRGKSSFLMLVLVSFSKDSSLTPSNLTAILMHSSLETLGNVYTLLVFGLFLGASYLLVFFIQIDNTNTDHHVI